jgi:hypothetical protein
VDHSLDVGVCCQAERKVSAEADSVARFPYSGVEEAFRCMQVFPFGDAGVRRLGRAPTISGLKRESVNNTRKKE